MRSYKVAALMIDSVTRQREEETNLAGGYVEHVARVVGPGELYDAAYRDFCEAQNRERKARRALISLSERQRRAA